MEFNTIKTIKLINKDSKLQQVFNAKCDKYDYNGLLSAAEANTLADKAIETLKDIYESIILVSDTHFNHYDSINDKITTNRRYGKKQIQVDIKAQDGMITPNQTSMLLLADMKAAVATLHARGVSDRYKGTEKLTPTRLRKINAASRNFLKQVDLILKNK
jgi:hypothetical protein